MVARRVAVASRARNMNRRQPKLLNRSEFPADHVIFRQGDAGRVAYFVESGAVEILRMIDGREVVLDLVGPGQFFGELALLDGGERAATARAVGHTVCIPVPKEVFDAKTTTADPFLRIVIQMLCAYIRRYGQLVT
jgi:CRP/FNR family transcriptional regulator, cyclic AMP receptor protein